MQTLVSLRRVLTCHRTETQSKAHVCFDLSAGLCCSKKFVCGKLSLIALNCHVFKVLHSSVLTFLRYRKCKARKQNAFLKSSCFQPVKKLV